MAVVSTILLLFSFYHGAYPNSRTKGSSIAKKAQARETGARGLRSIIENVMLDIMFDLPDQPRGSRYVIGEEVVEGKKPLFEQPQTKSA